jgi:hypothetical protein
MADLLSPLAHEIIKAAKYDKLVVTGGEPAGSRELLERVTPEQLLSGAMKSRRHGDAMLAGLWLWHDCLDQSHAISQRDDSADGSYWHAIMHRREGDFSNSKYWLARCRSHPSAAAIGKSLPALRGLDAWDPFAFVDLVEAVHNRPDDPRRQTIVAIQQLEWRILFDHCAEAAMHR